jgi:protease-4
VFKSMVVDNRDLTAAEVEKLADGRVYTGGQAVANKLVDAIGDEDDAVIWLTDKKEVSTDYVKDVDIYKKETGIEKLFSSLSGANSLLPEILSLKGLLSVWSDGIM